MVESMAEDHAHAKLPGQLLADVPGLRVNVDEVETNMVIVDHSPCGLPTPELLKRLETHAVLTIDRPPETRAPGDTPPSGPGNHRGSRAVDSRTVLNCSR